MAKSKLKNRLDVVFAKYIRLRDVMPNGMFRCISCGNILPFDESDCGHYINRQHMATRFSEKKLQCPMPNVTDLMKATFRGIDVD
mgnify:CR=1 FL=1